MPKTVILTVAVTLTLLATPFSASAKIDNETASPTVSSAPTALERNTRSGQCGPCLVCIWSEVNYAGPKMGYVPAKGCIQALTGSTRPGARSIINNSNRQILLFAEPSCPQDWMIVIKPDQKIRGNPFREPHSIMSMRIDTGNGR